MASDLPRVKTSFFSMPFSNGSGAGVYQAKKKGSKLLYFYDHLYKAYDAKTTTRTFIRKGMFWGINEQWLPKLALKKAEYINGTGIVQVSKKMDDLELTEYYWMPNSSDKRIIINILSVKNTGKETSLSPYFYQDNALGGGGSSKNEMAKRVGDILIEYKEAKKNAMSMITAFDSLDKASYVPYKDMEKDLNKSPMKIKDRIVQKGDNLIGVHQLKNTRIGAGQTRMFLAVTGLSLSEEEPSYIAEIKKILAQSPESLLEQEIKGWQDWHTRTSLPPGISPEEKALFLQSAAVLRMGQVREKGSPFGQILASMPPGMWNIAWVRDGAYSLLGFIQTGHLEEARWGLEFMLNAPNGKFDAPEYVGKPYKISVCRYWGNGEEESDYNNFGPNVEWDNFGLFLWAFSEYVRVSGDQQFLAKYYPVAKELVADVLIHLMSKEGYLVRDSSIWERHWEPQGSPPDGRKHFSYSTINAINGLRQLAQVAPSATHKKQLLDASDKMWDGFKKHMISSENIIVSCIEEKGRGSSYYMDASVVEALNFGLVDKKTAQATLDAFEKHLRMKNSPGFLRNDDAKDYEHSWYDEQEWVVIDLRVAHAYHLWGNKERAEELNRWVVENARQNYNLIPELLEQNKLSFEGAVPMMGFGPGAYILNMYQKYKP